MLNIYLFYLNNVYIVNSVLGVIMYCLFCNWYWNLVLLIEKILWIDVRFFNFMYLYSLILKEYVGIVGKFKEIIFWFFIYGVKMLVWVDYVIIFYKV